MDPITHGSLDKDALVGLLDDPSPVVRRALLAYFQALGTTGEMFLRELADGPNRIAAGHARSYLAELKFSDPVSEFRGFIRSLNYELETGVLLMCRAAYPALEIARFGQELDRIAARCRELMTAALPPRERCKIINRVLFHEYGFRGNIEDYTDPENSFLHRVLETRKGLPISLSILYLLIAERCGVRLEPVGLPGHFVVGCFRDEQVFFIDAFDRGRFLTAEELLGYLAGRDHSPLTRSLAPSTVREVLCRCCRNLANHYAEAGLQPLARLYASFVEEFDAAIQSRASS
jgi:regulator of sirC expression with transglutaminase-like and TPR domain